MATGLDGFAAFLVAAKEEMGEFEARPYYEPETDSLIYYTRDVSSYSKRVSKYLTVFLSNDDDSLVGIEVKGFKTSILPAIEGMGDVPVADCTVTNEDGETLELSVIARFALAPEMSDQFRGNRFDELNRATSGVRVKKGGLCGC